mgnify:CR=1 FL=1
MNGQQQDRLYAAIFNTVIDGVITIDERGTIETVNPAAAELFGYAAVEIMGQKVNMLMPEPHRTDHDKYLYNYKSTGVKKIIGIGREVRGKRKDGTEFPFRLAISEVHLSTGRVFTGIIHDLTEQKRAEKRILEINDKLEQRVAERTEELSNVVNKLIQSNRELEAKELELIQALDKERELSELKSRFVTTASHEFRTPLSTILSSASLIARYTEPGTIEKRNKHINRIKKSVKNLTGILNDFLSLSKLEEGKVESQIHDFNLTDLCSEVIEHIGTTLKKDQQVVFINDIKNENVHGDERSIRNVMINLLSNASKYSDEGKKIIFKITNDEKAIHFSVKDNGIGIPADEQQYLFTRFFRANNVSNIQGTGLGLNIVKRYLDLMDGTIKFESEEGEGTKFRVSVPL